MFGPNTYFTDNVVINGSHRDQAFYKLFGEVKELFIKKFDLDDYDVIFIPGSATVGVEAVMFSMNYNITVIGNDGSFKKRWTSMLENYPKPAGCPDVDLCCRLESSVSAPFYKEGCVLDAVSAFPYYSTPKDTRIFCTCLNKQLGSYTGLAVVCVKKDQWKYCVDSDKISYLNLRIFKDWGDKNQTPYTTPTYIYEHFHKVLKNFDLDQFRERINKVSDLLCRTIPEEFFVGEKRCPVLTLKKEAFPDKSFPEKCDLYGYWTNRPYYQIYTYTSPYEDYEEFCRQYKCLF